MQSTALVLTTTNNHKTCTKTNKKSKNELKLAKHIKTQTNKDKNKPTGLRSQVITALMNMHMIRYKCVKQYSINISDNIPSYLPDSQRSSNLVHWSDGPSICIR